MNVKKRKKKQISLVVHCEVMSIIDGHYLVIFFPF